MSLRRFAKKRDATEPEVVAQVRQCGWYVKLLNMQDWPDWLCARGGRLVLAELKTEDGEVSEGQQRIHELLAIFGIEVIVFRTAEEFLNAVDSR
jgi:hypothetical protein